MIATLLQLYHRFAIITALPAGLFGNLDKLLRLLVLGTFPARMPLTVAKTTHLQLAARAPAILASDRAIHVYVRRLDPLATASGRTVYAILCRILLVFPVPENLEFVVEEAIDVLEGDVVLRAAPGWHVLRIRYGHGENAAETRVTHSMTASQLCAFRCRNIVGKTCETLDPNFYQQDAFCNYIILL